MRYLAIMLLLTACGSPPTGPADKPPTYEQPKVEKFISRTYRVSETEHVVIMDIPDRFVPRRCAVFVDDLTKTSHMSCNFDDAGGALPEDNSE